MAEFTLDMAFPSFTGDTNVDGVIWDEAALWTYEFPDGDYTVTYYFMDEPALESHYGDPVTNFATMNDTQREAARQIFDIAEELTDLVFVESEQASGSDILFGTMDIPYENTVGITYDYLYYETELGGTVTYLDRYVFVYLDNAEFASYTDSPTQGTYGYEYLMHEIGHALNLEDTAISQMVAAEYDNTNYTVMSYNDGGEAKTTYQQLDVAALQSMYGSGSRALAVSTDSYDFGSSENVFGTLAA